MLEIIRIYSNSSPFQTYVQPWWGLVKVSSLPCIHKPL